MSCEQLASSLNQSQVSPQLSIIIEQQAEVTRHCVGIILDIVHRAAALGLFSFHHCYCGLFLFFISLMCVHEKVSSFLLHSCVSSSFLCSCYQLMLFDVTSLLCEFVSLYYLADMCFIAANLLFHICSSMLFASGGKVVELSD